MQLALTLGMTGISGDEKLIREGKEWTREIVRQIIRETAEACAELCEEHIGYLPEEDRYISLTQVAAAIRASLA